MSMDRIDTSSTLLSPSHSVLRALILDYLCHQCYPNTAQAFAAASMVKRLDSDGDELMEPPSSSLESLDLSEELLGQVRLRESVRYHILRGQVDDAIALIEGHFPAVIAVSHELSKSLPANTGMDYIASPSIEPAHINLNLRILAFIEACRTRPLVYPLEASSYDAPPQISGHTQDSESQLALIRKAQKLSAMVKLLRTEEEQVTYDKELANVHGLLAYKEPEESPLARYMSQQRREAVADQVNCAILHHMRLPPISYLELYIRYTSAAWSLSKQVAAEPSPKASLPPGWIKKGASDATNLEHTELPFTLQTFLASTSSQ